VSEVLRGAVMLAALAGCAASAPTGPTLGPTAAGDEPVVADRDAGPALRDAELRWLAAHLADDADPSHPGESPAVRRLVSYGAAGARVVAEVFRVGDERRAPYARSVIERVMRAHCRRDAAGVARTRRWLFAAAADASVATWPEGSRWPLERVERLRSWAERDAPCE